MLLYIEDYQEEISRLENDIAELNSVIPHCKTRVEAEYIQDEIENLELNLEDLREEMYAFDGVTFALLIMHGDIEPEVKEFFNEEERDSFARQYREENGDEDGLYPVHFTGKLEITSYSGMFFNDET